jgi:hypothetical protein
MGELASARGVPNNFGAAGRRGRLVAPAGCDCRRSRPTHAGPPPSRIRRIRFLLIASGGHNGVLILLLTLN